MDLKDCPRLSIGMAPFPVVVEAGSGEKRGLERPRGGIFRNHRGQLGAKSVHGDGMSTSRSLSAVSALRPSQGRSTASLQSFPPLASGSFIDLGIAAAEHRSEMARSRTSRRSQPHQRGDEEKLPIDRTANYPTGESTNRLTLSVSLGSVVFFLGPPPLFVSKAGGQWTEEDVPGAPNTVNRDVFCTSTSAVSIQRYVQHR